jgi:SAM-dependent methyltransferase
MGDQFMPTTLQPDALCAQPAVQAELSCRICGNAHSSTIHRVPEMMYGLREEFNYLECHHCGCLQLLEHPDDPSKYYGPHYYAYQKPAENALKAFLRRRLVQHALYRKNLIGHVLSKRLTPPTYCDWFKKCAVTPESEILDVGCGNGGRILKMHSDGFRCVTGLDPYIQEDIRYECGVTVHKKYLRQMDGVFDFIMLNHSFEHMADPLDVMQHLRRLVSPSGYVLIRIPVASSHAWRKYGVHWVQLDAPRHVFLHTPRSISLLAGQVQMRVVDITYDSCEFQFWGSEQYKQGIPLTDPRSYCVNAGKSIFSKAQIEAFRAQSRILNANNAGDSACFFLRKA